MRPRRVGSVTFGLTLVLFGVLFLIHIVVPTLHYEMIFQFWPVVFVLLGVEILVENHKSNAEQCRFVYDFPAILSLLPPLLIFIRFPRIIALTFYIVHFCILAIRFLLL